MMVAVRNALATLMLTFGASACAATNVAEPGGAADCQRQVRLNGVTYTSYGYTEREATRYAVVDEVECHDVRPAVGSVFSDEPQKATAWSFAGYSPEMVLGVRFEKDSFAVFVADSVPTAESERIFRQLRRPTN